MEAMKQNMSQLLTKPVEQHPSPYEAKFRQAIPERCQQPRISNKNDFFSINILSKYIEFTHNTPDYDIKVIQTFI